MKISIVVATNRPAMWERFCTALADNVVDFEVIMVGPVLEHIPETPLPVPTRFLNVAADVGTAKCAEIGARSVSGDLLGFAADDCVYSAGFLDDVVKVAAQKRNLYDMFSARYVFNHNELKNLCGHRLCNLEHMPVLPIGGISYTEDHYMLGGIDKRFDSVLWDSDLYMHMRVLGGHVEMLKAHTYHEMNTANSLFESKSPKDWRVFHSFWPTPLMAGMQRALPRESWEM